METETYKGLRIEYVRDEDPQSPNDWGDDNVFLVADHRDFYVLPPNTKRGSGWDLESVYNEYNKTHHVFSLEAYIHSGVVLALANEGNFPDMEWDVSRLGLVFVAKSEKRLRSSARKLAIGLIGEWNIYLSGEVYGYRILDKDGNDVASCYGFYGEDAVREEAKAEADGVYSDIVKKHTEKKCAEITNRAPLSKRSSLSNRLMV